MFVKDSYVGYLNETGAIGCIILMDPDFKILSGTSQVGLKRGFLVSNASRQLYVKAWTKRKAQEWADSIQNAMTSTGNVVTTSIFKRKSTIMYFLGFRERFYRPEPFQ